MIEADGLTKRHGGAVIVDELTFSVRPGAVTGFLGPNGAGKSTTLRLALGLASPSGGRVSVGGRVVRELPRALRHVGALLDAGDVHRGRSGAAHLAILARSNGIARGRVDEVLAEAGLAEAARRRVGTYSLGMRQRLGIAAALLGDPPVLVLDEPFNGLAPDGVRWARRLLRRLADEGRTVFVASHLMSEMENTADHLVVLARGRVVADESTQNFAARGGLEETHVRTPDPDALAAAVAEEGGQAHRTDGDGDGGLTVTGLGAQQIGELAARRGLTVTELSTRTGSLEEAFLRLTGNGEDR